jgi:hypothetical protein
MEQTPISKSLLAKLNKITSEVSYIQKDKTNQGQGYKYASEAAIKGAINKAFTVNGVQFMWSVDGVQHDPATVVKTSSGSERTVYQATVKCSWKMVDIETGEYIEGYGVGVGQDSGDKAIYKAITGALKYVLTGNFLIETGDDVENDENEPTEPVHVPVETDVYKICTKCARTHKGQWDKCYDCWKKDQPAK